MKQRRTNGRAGALTADDWVDAAVRAIAEQGVGAVAIEPIAQRLGVTKGSFYWHFPDRAALLRAAVQRWEDAATEAVGAAFGSIVDPRERLTRLVVDASAEEGRAEVGSDRGVAGSAFALAIADAALDPIVGPVVRRVAARRIAVLEACYRALGYGGDAARSRALLAHAAHLGTLRLMREAPDWAPRGEDLRAYRRLLVAALVPAEGSLTDEAGSASGS